MVVPDVAHIDTTKFWIVWPPSFQQFNAQFILTYPEGRQAISPRRQYLPSFS